MPSLICEGTSCNPTIGETDANIIEFRKVDEGMEYAAVPPQHLLDDLHELKHTEHRVMGQFFACKRCGCVRVF